LVGIRLEKLEIVEWEHGKHFVRCLLSNKHDAFKWDLVIIYGAAQSAGKEDFLREFSQVCQQRKFSTVYVGDFNLIRHAGEKNMPGGMSKWNTILGFLFSCPQVVSCTQFSPAA
jgi:hypothetical protein